MVDHPETRIPLKVDTIHRNNRTMLKMDTIHKNSLIQYKMVIYLSVVGADVVYQGVIVTGMSHGVLVLIVGDVVIRCRLMQHDIEYICIGQYTEDFASVVTRHTRKSLSCTEYHLFASVI